ncbi:galactokinase [Aquimarina sp. 2201CG5-10]|uniref:galactokinase n=1 Tax=Aquimarina callyspongiae TaxID=3098150 RepID=UPI002AB55F9E|nr:galactokinase [Aquimarina sp. 2201CG5-10]MDY8137970.1 galactokinase [Aquimarina sp. 2201CG5-10]
MNKNLVTRVKTVFKQHFNEEPLVVFAPGRINLIGEHTDYNEGFVFPAAIDKGIYAAFSKSNDAFSKVIALDVDDSHQFTTDIIKPLHSGSWKNYVLGVIAEIQKKERKVQNFNLVFSGDIPSGAGLSSSAALENVVAFGLNELLNLQLSKKELIYVSQKAEHNFVGVKCGIMDQYASMFGKENSAILLDCRDLSATIFNLDFEDYEIVLINSNVQHELAESEYNERRAVCEKVASLLKVNALRDVNVELLKTIENKLSDQDYQKALYVIEENERVLTASKTLKEKNYQELGKLLFASNDGLQNQYKVSCKELIFLVDLAKKNQNVLGARMMGAGFGGCTINLVHKDSIDNFIDEASNAFFATFNHRPTAYQVKLGNGVRLVNQ